MRDRNWEDHRTQHLYDDIERTTREIHRLEIEGRRWRREIRNQNWRVRQASNKTIDSLQHLEDSSERQDVAARHSQSGGSGSGFGSRSGSGGMGFGGARSQEDVIYMAVTAGAAVLAVLVGIILAAGHLSAALFQGGVPKYELADVPTLLFTAASNPGDPSAGWEKVAAPASPVPPGASLFWPLLLLLLAAIALPAWYGYRAGWFTGQQKRSSSDLWAHPSQLRPLHVSNGEDSVVVGTLHRHKIGVRDSLLVTGPAHAGKTSLVAIPAVLSWNGPVIVASADPRLVDQTIGWRSRLGDVHVYDPSAATFFHRSGWNPLHNCVHWPEAVRMAQMITAAVGSTAADVSGLSLSSMALSLAPYLHAAAVDWRSVVQVAEWLARDERDEVTNLLRKHEPAAAAVHEASFGRDEESRKVFRRMMYDVFSVYLDPVVEKSAGRHEIVVDELFDGEAHSLYLTAPSSDYVRFTPIFATLVRKVLASVDDRCVMQGRPLSPRLLMVLDEAVGVVAAEDLVALVNTNTSTHGVQILSLLESAPPRVIQAHRARLMLRGGISEPSAPEGVAAKLQPGEAALITEGRRPARLHLPHWWTNKELQQRAKTPRDAVPARLPQDRKAYQPPMSATTALQTEAWRTRGSDPGPTERDDTLHGNDDRTNPGNVSPINPRRER